MDLDKTAKGARPRYLQDAETEKVLSIAMALAGEVAVLRDRLDSLESILGRDSVISRSELDAYLPSAEEDESRERWREGFLDIVLRSVLSDVKHLEDSVSGASSYDGVVEAVSS